MGVFSYVFAREMRLYPQATYRQLAQAIAQAYDTISPSVPTPFFEGDLDIPVFGEEGDAASLGWTAQVSGDLLRLLAGQLHGLDEGAVVELHPYANADKSLGFARITKAGLSASEASPIEYRGTAPPIIADLPQTMIATMAARGLAFGLKIALPPASDRSVSGEAAFKTIDALQKLPIDARGFATQWVKPDQTADIYLRVKGELIYFVPPSGEIVENGRNATVSLRIAPDGQNNIDQLRDDLLRIARYFNLLRMVQVVQNSAADSITRDVAETSSKSADTLEIKTFLLRDPSHAVTKFDESHDCPGVPLNEIPKGAVEIDANQAPELVQCDVIYVEMRNRGTKPVDATVLYVDSHYGIQAFELNGRVRIESEELRPRILPIQIVTWGKTKGSPEPGPLTTGMERIVVVGVERDLSNSDTISFAYWAQPGLKAAQLEMQRRGPALGKAVPFVQLMQDAALAPVDIRGAQSPRSDEIENATMRTFRWEVVAPSTPAAD